MKWRKIGLVKYLFGTYKIKYHVHGLDHEPVEIDFTPPYKRISLLSALEEALGKEDKFPLASELTTDEANKFFDNLCLVKYLFGTYKIKYHVHGLAHESVEIDFTPPYKRISLLNALEEALGKEDKFPLASELTTDINKANKFFDNLCKKHHVECTHPRTTDKLIDKRMFIKMMLSFIRKRLPYKDRSNEHLQNAKSNHIQHEHQDDNNMKRTQSTNELNLNNNDNKKKKKKKNKEMSSSTLDGLALVSNTSPTTNRINKSYSDIDYFPLMPEALFQSNNHDKISKERDSLSDSYLNPSENVHTTSDINYVQTTVIKPRVFEIPVIDCRKEQRIPNYKDVDHQRTQAIRQVTQQRTQQRLIK
ncbi:unnamed protein product [Rotaria sordida]|uniref:Uncharacterized protein n=1 Tax=Rotaria sordida TaxID=392033 RepID=A0A815CQ72_9BILA|nr:unnamed protein product [Rotaria sordida]